MKTVQAVQAIDITNFSDSVKTDHRRIKESDLKDYAAARNTILRPYKEARIGFALEHLDQNNAFWTRVVFSFEKVFQSCSRAVVSGSIDQETRDTRSR
mgnify:CR=1 FL=1